MLCAIHQDVDSPLNKRAEAVAPAIRALNPRVKVQVDPSNVTEKPDTFFQSFDIVCMIHQDAATLVSSKHPFSFLSFTQHMKIKDPCEPSSPQGKQIHPILCC